MPSSYGFKQIYVDEAKQSVLNADIDATVTSITVVDASNWPSPGTDERALAAIDFGKQDGSMEVIRYSGRTGNTLTGCERGLNGTGQQAHTAGAQMRHVASANDIAEFFEHQYRADHYSEVLNVRTGVTGNPYALDLKVGTNWDLTLSGATTLSFTNVKASPVNSLHAVSSLYIVVRNTGTAYAITWPASVKWANAATPSLSGVNKADIFTLVTMNGGTTWAGSVTAGFVGL